MRDPFDLMKCVVICKERYNRSLIRNVIINAGLRGENLLEGERVDDINHMPLDGFTKAIIVDHTEYSSLDYLKIINASPMAKNIPVIIIINDGAKEFIMKAIQLGVSGIILRPLNAMAIKKNLEKALSLTTPGVKR